MDPRLLEAAQTGNVGLLNDLIGSNALILEEAALQGAGHTPLHVACVAGRLNFVRELLKLMPKLAENVNADGFSPLHITAARGDVEIVREILKAGRPQHLCLVKGRERIIPLHCAATNGNVGAMKELLSASPESVEETTAREETALHISMKNNRFDTLVVLVEHLKQHKKEQVINWQDKKGDTILHLAAAAKNFEARILLPLSLFPYQFEGGGDDGDNGGSGGWPAAMVTTAAAVAGRRGGGEDAAAGGLRGGGAAGRGGARAMI
ncbi:hypothetical protein NL676_009372 [Syzygium grande]|nr:hypothetical protein NL676_009372 [Syzygium grande]